jgi:hypothetical protein
MPRGGNSQGLLVEQSTSVGTNSQRLLTRTVTVCRRNSLRLLARSSTLPPLTKASSVLTVITVARYLGGGWGRLRVGDNSGSELSFGSLGGYVVEIIKLDKGGTDGLE